MVCVGEVEQNIPPPNNPAETHLEGIWSTLPSSREHTNMSSLVDGGVCDVDEEGREELKQKCVRDTTNRQKGKSIST